MAAATRVGRSASERRAVPARLPALVLAAAVLGALLLLVAEPSTLYTVRVAPRSAAAGSTSAGSHHAFALVPIALLAAALSFGARRSAGRGPLLALGALGVCALLIALVGDLPDARAHGITQGFVLAGATPGIALYLETLGALLLVLASGLGLAVLPSPVRPRLRQATRAVTHD